MKSEKIIFIPKGSTKAIIAYLQNKNYNMSFLDVYFLRLIGMPQHGFIEIPQENLNKAKFLNALVSSKAAMTSVTLIPGETNYFFLREIAQIFQFEDIALLESLYHKYAPYDDGVILANTYSLPYHADEEFVIRYLVQTSLAKHEQLAMELLGNYDESVWFKYVAKASVIQKEAANVAEMPLVSSVIDNRIAKNMPLQMDGSLNYAEYSHSKITPARIRNDTSEFNTYKYTGIPKTPICSVSVEALRASVNPAQTKYLYFMRNKNGVHDFTETYKEHVKNINRVKN